MKKDLDLCDRVNVFKKKLKLKTGQSRSWNRKQIRKEVQTENIAFGKKINFAFA